MWKRSLPYTSRARAASAQARRRLRVSPARKRSALRANSKRVTGTLLPDAVRDSCARLCFMRWYSK